MSATVYVARHGETTWNVSGRYQGRLESPLSDLGIAQGHALAGYFGGLADAGAKLPARIVSSPLERCTATALFVGDRLGLHVTTDARLIEIAHGTWEGRYRAELEANDSQRYRAWRTDPAHVAFDGGETLHDVRARWRGFAGTLLGSASDVLIVTHDAVCRVAILDATSRGLDDFWNVRVENAGFARLDAGPAGLTLLEECHTEHLGALRASLGGQAL